ncbi:MAG TPA: Wzz/FepE/Etk N-terminal domain-containing protein [Bryobacteraceae bacterium]
MSLDESIAARNERGTPGEIDFWREPEVSLLDALAVLARRRRLIAGVTLAAMALTATVVLLMRPSYTAEAVILPPVPDQSSQAMMLGPLTGLGGLAGGSLGLSSGLFRNPAELYVGVLKGRTIADSLIARFHLQQIYGTANLTATRKRLARQTDVSVGKDSLIHIRVDDHDRALSAGIANAYVEELHKRNSNLAINSASQRRLFFQQQLAVEKDAVADAEIALKNTQQSSGLLFPTGQSEVAIRSIAQLRAEIAAREVQRESMRAYATDDHPQVRLLEREIAALREQLGRLDTGNGERGALALPATKLPDAGLAYIRKLRDLRYHEALYEILAKQYEAARIDEAKLAPVIQVIDSAVVPDTKSWPPRTLFVLGSGCLALLCACAFVLVRSPLRRAMQ